MEYISKLFSFIPDRELEAFALDTGVNKYAKKLQGELLFKLLIFCILTEKDNSLRGMQSALESSLFRAMNPAGSAVSIAHSSISERLNSINPAYFKRIFVHCITQYKSAAEAVDQQVIRFDSTIVSLSSKLLHTGYHLKGGDADKYRLLKFTIGYSDIPDCICFYTDQKYNSENAALKESILLHQQQIGKLIAVFDRGITARASYDAMTKDSILYVSRITPQPSHTAQTGNRLKTNVETGSLTITGDCWVYLYNEKRQRSKYPVRMITALKKADGKPIAFISNIKKITAKEITEIYKTRWDIEAFFKVIKQYLNFAHLLNRSHNGIQVVMYISMIAAILLAEYKRQKGLKGHKIAKRKFTQELERDIIYNIVLLCGGDPEKAQKMIFPNSS